MTGLTVTVSLGVNGGKGVNYRQNERRSITTRVRQADFFVIVFGIFYVPSAELPLPSRSKECTRVSKGG